MRFISKTEIEVEREFSDLDLFTIDFIGILEKYADYVIISGYVSILLGRSRSSEDVDIIIPKVDFLIVNKLLEELKKKDFYCLNTSNNKEAFDYLNDSIAIRFAKVNKVIPNIELKFAKNKFDELALEKKIKIKLGKKILITSHLELQVAFKEVVLKSPKDIEDARHIRNVAKEYLDNELIKKYSVMLNEFFFKRK